MLGRRDKVHPSSITQEEESQAYLISVSDMMAGLLFLFIITLMVFVVTFHDVTTKKTKQLDEQSMQLQKRNEELEIKSKELAEKKIELQKKVWALTQKEAELQQAIAEKAKTAEKLHKISLLYEQKTEELLRARATRATLLRELKALLSQKGVHVQIDPDQGILRMPAQILFPSGSADLQPSGKKNLEKLASILLQVLPCYSGDKAMPKPDLCPADKYRPGTLDAVLVEGHTDNVPLKGTGTFKDNWDLSAKRSIITYQEMLHFQPRLDKLLNENRQALFCVSGYADTRPVVTHNKPTAEPLNRRIDLRFILAPPPMDELDVIKDIERNYGN